MKPKLIIVLALLVIGPMTVIGWLGVRTALQEQESVRRQRDALLTARLADFGQTISKVIERRERELKRLAEQIPDTTSQIRELTLKSVGIGQIFVVDAKGGLKYPPRDEPRTQAEDAFIERTKAIFENKERFFRVSDRDLSLAKTSIGTAPSDQGWHTYYYGSTDHFIFWLHETDGELIGFDLNRPALIADIVGELPYTDPKDLAMQNERIQLVSAQGDVVYAFGSHEPLKDEQPVVRRELSSPLGAWRLSYFLSEKALAADLSQGALFGTVAGLAGLIIAVCGLAFYFFRESGREAREAQQRVTFVNQVSHELKTPLTNIRMYAELLQEEIDERESKSRAYLDVIVSESERLSRLIGNVLSFARHERKKLTVRYQPGRIDQAVGTVIEQFRLGLESAGFEIANRVGDKSQCEFDPDILRQILANLLSNAEKYAKTGKWVEITSSRRGQTVTISVADRGPGIPKSAKEKIFEPFFRLSQKIAEGVSGTGIGLSISRELARLHGGDLCLVDTPSGARFEVTLHAPVVKGETSL